MPASHIQQAIFKYVTDTSVTIQSAAIAHDLNPSTFHRIYRRWMGLNRNTSITSPSDIVAPPTDPGRPRIFTKEEEDLMAETIVGFQDDGWPLTIHLVQQVAEHYLQRYCPDDRNAKCGAILC